MRRLVVIAIALLLARQELFQVESLFVLGRVSLALELLLVLHQLQPSENGKEREALASVLVGLGVPRARLDATHELLVE